MTTSVSNLVSYEWYSGDLFLVHSVDPDRLVISADLNDDPKSITEQLTGQEKYFLFHICTLLRSAVENIVALLALLRVLFQLRSQLGNLPDMGETLIAGGNHANRNSDKCKLFKLAATVFYRYITFFPIIYC